MTRHRTITGLVAAAVVFTAACGGGDTGSTGNGAIDAADAPEATPSAPLSDVDAGDTDTAPTDDADDTDIAPADDGGDVGTVVIDGTSYELTLTRCNAFMGIGLEGVGDEVDGDATVTFDLTDDDSGTVDSGVIVTVVDPAAGHQWSSRWEGYVGLDHDGAPDADITIDGRSASGTASFIDVDAITGSPDDPILPGDFTFHCT